MTTICLVRHGETEWNRQGRLQGREDTELNDVGRAQADATGRFLARDRWDAVASSPLKRARETASIIAKHVAIATVHEFADLVERDYGASSGLTPAERSHRFPDGDVPGIESREALTQRAMQALRSLAEMFPRKRIIVVTHGGVINAILAAITNGEIGSGKTPLKNACINVIHLRRGAWHIETYNSTAHFDQTA